MAFHVKLYEHFFRIWLFGRKFKYLKDRLDAGLKIVCKTTENWTLEFPGTKIHATFR